MRNMRADAFKHETERLVNDLMRSAQFAEEKLEDIKENSEQLIYNSNQIQESLTSIDYRTQEVAQTTKDVGDRITSIDHRTQEVAQTTRNVGDQINVVLIHAKEIFEQSKGLAASQSDLMEGQREMKRKTEAGMEMLHDSYNSLGQDIEKLRNEAVEIEREINEVGNLMSLKMSNLQNKADDIGNVAGKSLDKQMLLLEGQSSALEGLDFLTKYQSELMERQTEMKRKMEAGMEMLHDSYNSLGQDIEKLRNEAIEIEREINEVGKSMSVKMSNLQNKADDIGDVASKSLDKQMLLLEGQSTALEGLDALTKYQSRALEESRITLQKLAEFGHKQQEELLHRQEQLQNAHDRLFENSKTIIEAQEAFESKQATMFIALDKLFMLHNAILLESRSIKAFFYYSLGVFLIYMLTSAKATYHVRARLYLGLCVSFLVELTMYRFGEDLDRQTWIQSNVNAVRLFFLVIGAIQILYSAFTYRDYEKLNYKMLVNLSEKVNNMERNSQLFVEMESDDDIDFSTWVDTELPEEDYTEDPDFIPAEEIAENSVTTSLGLMRYDLRPRSRQKLFLSASPS